MALNAARISETTELEQAQAALASKTLLSQEMALDRTEVINGAMAASGVCGHNSLGFFRSTGTRSCRRPCLITNSLSRGIVNNETRQRRVKVIQHSKIF